MTKIKTRFEPDAGIGDVPPTPRADRPEGAAVAALLAVGIGATTLGALTTLAEASERWKGWLELSTSVGPLSGKTTVTVLVWLAAWAVLHPVLRTRARLSNRVLVGFGTLLLLGLVGTFPIFFQLFAPE
jgi:hypothetical protein